MLSYGLCACCLTKTATILCFNGKKLAPFERTALAHTLFLVKAENLHRLASGNLDLKTMKPGKERTQEPILTQLISFKKVNLIQKKTLEKRFKRSSNQRLSKINLK